MTHLFVQKIELRAHVLPPVQWRSQGVWFGGANAEGVSNVRGVRGHVPPENFEM